MELWLCRHGETEWSREGRHTGRTDLPLTPVGQAAARAVGDLLAGIPFDLVLTSPLRRAADTAALAGFPDARLEPAAVEWDYGDYEGRTTDAIRHEAPGWTIWTGAVPGGETAEAVGARADAVIERLRGGGWERVALFSHGHLLRVLAARWIGLPPKSGAHLALETATVSVLGHERETPAILRWNMSAPHPNGRGGAQAGP